MGTLIKVSLWGKYIGYRDKKNWFKCWTEKSKCCVTETNVF